MSKKVLRFSRSFMFSSLRLKLSSILRFLVMWESSRFGMRLSSLPNTNYWRHCLFPIVYSCLLCHNCPQFCQHHLPNLLNALSRHPVQHCLTTKDPFYTRGATMSSWLCNALILSCIHHPEVTGLDTIWDGLLKAQLRCWQGRQYLVRFGYNLPIQDIVCALNQWPIMWL